MTGGCQSHRGLDHDCFGDGCANRRYVATTQRADVFAQLRQCLLRTRTVSYSPFPHSSGLLSHKPHLADECLSNGWELARIHPLQSISRAVKAEELGGGSFSRDDHGLDYIRHLNYGHACLNCHAPRLSFALNRW